MAVDLPKLAITLAGSVVVCLQTIVQHKEGGWNLSWVWALIVSGLSSLICIPAFAIQVLRSEEAAAESRGVPSMILAVLWAAGAAPMTLVGPYALTGNGYFGTWVALTASWLMAIADHSFLREHLEMVASGRGNSMVVLLLASLTAFVQTAWSCSTVDGWCNANAAWVLVCSGVSLIICVMLFASQVADRVQPHFKFIAFFLLLWWAGAVVITFESPYETSYANGYFSCWAAVAASVSIAQNAWGLSFSSTALTSASEVSGGSPPEIIVLLAASLVTLIAAAIDCGEVACTGLEVWAILCSLVSFVLCFTMIVHTMTGGWITGESIVERSAIFLVTWWTLGIMCMTFGNPFRHLGNGYFASWIAFVATCLFASKNIEKARQTLGELGNNGREIGAISLASIVLFVQALWDCTSDHCIDGKPWALACSLVSLAICIGMAFSPRLQEHYKYIVAILFIWWSAGVGVLTFHKPYVRTGNAYFSCWCAWCASGWLIVKQVPKLHDYANLDWTGMSKSAAPPAEGLSSAASPVPGSFTNGATKEAPELEDGEGKAVTPPCSPRPYSPRSGPPPPVVFGNGGPQNEADEPEEVS